MFPLFVLVLKKKKKENKVLTPATDKQEKGLYPQLDKNSNVGVAHIWGLVGGNSGD